MWKSIRTASTADQATGCLASVAFGGVMYQHNVLSEEYLSGNIIIHLVWDTVLKKTAFSAAEARIKIPVRSVWSLCATVTHARNYILRHTTLYYITRVIIRS